MSAKPKKGDLMVWWVRNPPSAGRRYPVENVKAAVAMINKLANADLKSHTVTCNAGGLEEFDGREWSEYSDEDGRDIDAIMER